MHFDSYIPTRIIFGRGRLEELAALPLPGKKALIVITNGKSMRNLGYLDRVIRLLEQNGAAVVVFDKILPNPVVAHVMEAAELARNENCDFIIGLGGGSAIDSAKSIALMIKNSGTYWDYVKRVKKITEPVLPIIAIPTTAGTGTEVDPWTVITNPDTGEKIGFGDDVLFPKLAIVDSELMTSVPQRLTAYQGMDAFFHAVEGYLACVAQPLSDILAIETIRLVAEFLPQAVKDGNNLQAREQMAWAATAAGLVESTSSCISEHSMEHALSAFYPELPHGAGLVALSVPYFTHLLKKEPEKVSVRYLEMGRAMGEEGNSPEIFIAALKKLIDKVGLSDLRLSDWGIKPDEAERLAANSYEAMGALYELDPVRLQDDDTVQIFREAIMRRSGE